MNIRRSLVVFVAVALAAGSAPITVQAQLRPDRSAVDTATRLKDQRASASDVSKELQSLRQSPAQITAVLNAVGYTARQIGEVHRNDFRMDAGTSARTTMEALRDQDMAFQVVLAVSRDHADALRVARSDLRMSAEAAVKSMKDAGVTRSTAAERVYADLGSAGYTFRAINRALMEQLTLSQIYDSMLAGGASLTQIAEELANGAGQSVADIVVLFTDKDAPRGEGAQALDAVGATTAEIVKWTLKDFMDTTQMISSDYAEVAGILVEVVGDLGEVMMAMGDEGIPLPVMVGVGVLFIEAEHGMKISVQMVDDLADLVTAIAGAGYSLVDIVGELHEAEITAELIAGSLFATGTAVTEVWGSLMGGLGWSADQVENVLADVIPTSLDFLSALVGLGGSGAAITAVVERLRDLGFSAIDIAAAVGEELGLVPMAQALWGAGYGAAEVTGGLVEGMQASASEAAQVVSGLMGGTP